MTAPRPTRQLLIDYATGRRIVCSLAPWRGREVMHAPRSTYDSEPWVLPGTDYRFKGSECHSEDH